MGRCIIYIHKGEGSHGEGVITLSSRDIACTGWGLYERICMLNRAGCA